MKDSLIENFELDEEDVDNPISKPAILWSSINTTYFYKEDRKLEDILAILRENH